VQGRALHFCFSKDEIKAPKHTILASYNEGFQAVFVDMKTILASAWVFGFWSLDQKA
jgi:hypothetical protein